MNDACCGWSRWSPPAAGAAGPHPELEPAAGAGGAHPAEPVSHPQLEPVVPHAAGAVKGLTRRWSRRHHWHTEDQGLGSLEACS
jgi:hypothetical protein